MLTEEKKEQAIEQLRQYYDNLITNFVGTQRALEGAKKGKQLGLS